MLEAVKVEELGELEESVDEDESFSVKTKVRRRRAKDEHGVKKPRQTSAPVDPKDGEKIFGFFDQQFEDFTNF
jgi:hypothetical protein